MELGRAHLDIPSKVRILVPFHSRGGGQGSSAKGKLVNMLGFAGHMAPFTTPQLCRRSAKASTHNM